MAKKLIEVALPLENINRESAREKSIRHGHPSTLHLWWARRPLAAARAVIWASLVDDPSEHPEMFPTEEDQKKERERLFKILSDLVVWENSNNEIVLNEAKTEIMKYTNGNPPALLDPFAGGGAIPLEAQRLGLESHAHDLNPVAVMINKAMIEIPPRFTDMSPVNPEDNRIPQSGWKGASGLEKDVEYYGNWMKEEAFKRIGYLYPKVKIPREQGGGEATVIAWIWARTVKCPNPACGCTMPLASSFVLSKKRGNEAWVKPIPEGKLVNFEVHYGKCPKEYESFKMGRGAVFKCPCCGAITTDEYVKKAGKNHQIGSQLMAIVAEGEKGRIYISPDASQKTIADISRPEGYPEGSLPNNPRWFSPPAFGITEYADLFTNRQLTALIVFSNLVQEAQQMITNDALKVGIEDDSIKLKDGGKGAGAYGEAISIYLAFLVDQLANHSSALCSWNVPNSQIRNTFARQSIPMVWDYAECNIFSNSSGSYNNLHERLCKAFDLLGMEPEGKAEQLDAQSDCGLRNVMVSTDPPYYDNIGYADLSDFFYVWMRKNLKNIYPDLFSTLLVPKAEELIASPYHHGGNSEVAKSYFEEGMLTACRQIYLYADSEIPVTIYYAYKQNGTDTMDQQIPSNGWETMLSAIIQAGFMITGTWPMRTEKQGRSIGIGTNALASSVVLVCRKRDKNARACTRRDFVTSLKKELEPAVKKLQQSNIAPVDLAQSAIGPGIGIFSRYKEVLESDGTPMTVRSALQIINQELDLYFSGQDSDMDNDSRFCVELFTQNAFNTVKFGDADILARAKGTSVARLAGLGVLYAAKGEVHLLERSELPEELDSRDRNVWFLTQNLTRAMETGGIQKCAEIVENIMNSDVEEAKNLAYRLYSICEKKNWSQEAFAYNALVVAWSEIQSRAAAIHARKPVQMTLEDLGMTTD